MPDKPAIQSRLTEILCNQLCLDAHQVTLESNIRDDLGCDSLDAIELIIAVESEWKITIPDDDADNFETVGELVDYITRRTNA